jgi:hypothetical protein
MPTTPGGLRYPASSDTPNVPRDIQYLATDVETALGTKSASSHVHNYVDVTLVNAAGDLLVGQSDNQMDRLPLGTDGQVLTVNAAGTGVNKVAWTTVSAGGGTIGLDSVFLLMGA